ncbi:MAG: site-specific DNA-methyltransferase [Myxococcales bacterium]|nr:site-specific DNA-methyltransferase [Myxococcales bacterium]
MRTTHRLCLGDARALPVADASVHLVVTSPPYPMIAMWDAGFSAVDPEIGAALSRGDGAAAFERMHRQLDEAWVECARVLVPGAWAAINIGDATRSLGTRTFGGSFALWPNHARVLGGAMRAGLVAMPDILWRKPTNAPNKFMGSGMLPGGAYVTYEHEYVLLLRKPGTRSFDAARRRESAYFWEERNAWFSDLWTGLPGERQAASAGRSRSAAFPRELPWRLIHMYSCLGDTVLDPFAGTGTTAAAALAAGRCSVSVEADEAVLAAAPVALQQAVAWGQQRTSERLAAHLAFVAARVGAGRVLKHRSPAYGPVVTGQERDLRFWEPVALSPGEGEVPWIGEHRVVS